MKGGKEENVKARRRVCEERGEGCKREEEGEEDVREEEGVG